MFADLNTLGHARLTRIFVLSTFLAAFGLFLAPTVAASPGLDSTLNAAGDVSTPDTSLLQGLADITITGDESHVEAPKVDKWVSRPLKQFNPHEVVGGTKMIKQLSRPDGDKTGFPASKPSIHWSTANSLSGAARVYEGLGA